MSEHSQPADWSFAGPQTFGSQAGPAPSQPFLQSPNMSQNRWNFSLWFEPPNSQQQGAPYVLPPASVPPYALAPPPNYFPSPAGWTGYYGNPSSIDWLPADLVPGRRACVSCMTSHGPLWRKAAVGGYLCFSCGLRQGPSDALQPPPKRRDITAVGRRTAAAEPVCNTCGIHCRRHQASGPTDGNAKTRTRVRHVNVKKQDTKQTRREEPKPNQSEARPSLRGAPPQEGACDSSSKL